MILATKTYVNYLSIETAIKQAIIQKNEKENEFHFTKHFLLPYEQSAYASYFLQHENNMLMRSEYIIKFEEMHPKKDPLTTPSQLQAPISTPKLLPPKTSRKLFIQNKIKE